MSFLLSVNAREAQSIKNLETQWGGEFDIGTRGRLTDLEKQKIIADYVELGNYTRVGEMHGVSEAYVRKIVKSNKDSANLYGYKKEQNKADILAHMESHKDVVCDIIDIYLTELSKPEKVSKATVSQITTALGTLVDKFTMERFGGESERGQDNIIEVTIRDFGGKVDESNN